MATGAPKKKKSARRGSFFLEMIDRFTAFIYSLFNNGRLGTWLSEDNAVYNESLCAEAIEVGSQKLKKSRVTSSVGAVVERSRALKLLGSLRDFLFCLSLSVYGVFFMTYGFTSIFVYYITILMKGANPFGSSAFVVSAITVITTIKSSLAFARELLFLFKGIIQRPYRLPSFPSSLYPLLRALHSR